MSRIVIITSATAALLISASALAWGWQSGSRLTLVTSNGKTVVGVGTVDERRLELTLSPDFSGFAVLVVEGTNGALATLDVVVDADGSILISDEGDFVDMGQSVAGAGLAFEVGVDGGGKREAGGNGNAAADGRGGGNGRAAGDADASGRPVGSDLPVERAAERAADGLERAEEAGGRAVGAADSAGRGATEAEVDTEVGAEVEVDVDVEGAGSGADVGLGVGAGDRVGNGRD
ncbi:MAG: hypothetical protein WD314_04635 [Trueperaceae bacterium]